MDPNASTSSSSLAVSYLKDSCGLSQTQALSSSEKIPDFETTSRADGVLTLLETFGFTKKDISKLVVFKFPKILLLANCSILERKLDYFKSKQISTLEFVNFLIKKPEILIKGLEESIIPFFDFIRSFLGSDRDTFTVLKRSFMLTDEAFMMKVVVSNVKVLRDENVPDKNIFKFLTKRPTEFMKTADKFKKTVGEVRCMGINPSKTAFVDWIHVLHSFTEENRKAKLDALREYGWTEDQIQHGIRLYPSFFVASVKKIKSVMDYLVNEMEYSVSSFKNLEKRIIPRISVFRFLISRHLIKGKHKVHSVLIASNENFLNKYVIPYEVEAPEVRQVYYKSVEKEEMELEDKEAEGDSATRKSNKHKEKKRKVSSAASVPEEEQEERQSVQVDDDVQKEKDGDDEGEAFGDNQKRKRKRKAGNEASVSKKQQESVQLNDAAADNTTTMFGRQKDGFRLYDFFQGMDQMMKAPSSLESFLNQEALRLVEPSKRMELETEWKNLQINETEVFLKRLNLVRDCSLIMVEALKSPS